MKRTLIRNGYIITMDPEDRRFFGDILIEGDSILDLGDSLDPAGADEIIDARGKLVIPGFVQGHIHLCQTLFRGLSQDRNLIDWLGVILPLERKHTWDSVYASARLSLAEMLRSGTTCIGVMGTAEHFSAETQAILDMGIRARMGRTIMDVEMNPGEPWHETRRGLQEAEDFLSFWASGAPERIHGEIAVRWILMTTEESFRGIREMALRYNVPIHNHADENLSENRMVMEKFGKTALEVFEEKGWTEAKMFLAHCIWLSDREKQILKQKDLRVIHCPGCNHKAASGVAPVPEYLSSGICVGLGADTGACNDNLDMFREMRLAALMQKIVHGPTVLTAEHVFRMATIDGARALYLDHLTGSLEKGKRGDLVILNVPLEAQPFHYREAVSSVVYSMGNRDVDLTMVNGSVVVRDGRLVSGEEPEIIREASRNLETLLRP